MVHEPPDTKDRSNRDDTDAMSIQAEMRLSLRPRAWPRTGSAAIPATATVPAPVGEPTADRHESIMASSNDESPRRLVRAVLGLACAAACVAASPPSLCAAQALGHEDAVAGLFGDTSLDSLVARHVQRLQRPEGAGSPAMLGDLFVAPTFQRTDVPETDLFAARQRDALRDVGLSAHAGVVENFEPGVSEADEGIYRRRAQVELRWDVLKGGFFESRLQARKLEYEEEATLLAARERERREWYQEMDGLLEAAFAEGKMSLLNDRSLALADLVDITAELYRRTAVPRDDLLLRMREQAEVAVELKHAAAVYAASGFAARLRVSIAPGPARSLPILEIAEERLDDFLGDGSLSRDIIDLQMEIEELERHPIRSVNVRPSLKYNVYQGGSFADGAVRDYVAASVAVSVPLSFRGGTSSEIAAAKRRTLEHEMEREIVDVRRLVRRRAATYKGLLRDYLRLHDEQLRLRARIGDAATMQRLEDPAYSPIIVLADVSALLDVQVRMVDQKMEMYRLLLEIAPYLEPRALMKITAPVDVPRMVHASRRDRSIYIWSETFKKHTNAFLLEELRRAEVGGDVYLSLGQAGGSTEKARHFIREAQSAGLDVHLMLGKRRLSADRDADRMRELVVQARSLAAGGIHLDIEPHTLDDWDERAAMYLDEFTTALAFARHLTSENGLALSISLPVFHDRGHIAAVVEQCDDVVLMAYGAHGTQEVLKRLVGDLAATASRLSVALRPDDFVAAEELDAYSEHLSRTAAVKGFVLSDAESLAARRLAGTAPPERAPVGPEDQVMSPHNGQGGHEEL